MRVSAPLRYARHPERLYDSPPSPCRSHPLRAAQRTLLSEPARDAAAAGQRQQATGERPRPSSPSSSSFPTLPSALLHTRPYHHPAHYSIALRPAASFCTWSAARGRASPTLSRCRRGASASPAPGARGSSRRRRCLLEKQGGRSEDEAVTGRGGGRMRRKRWQGEKKRHQGEGLDEQLSKARARMRGQTTRQGRR